MTWISTKSLVQEIEYINNSTQILTKMLTVSNTL